MTRFGGASPGVRVRVGVAAAMLILGASPVDGQERGPAPALRFEVDVPPRGRAEAPHAATGRDVRRGLLAASILGGTLGAGACAVVDRLDELPYYGCVPLGIAHALPVGLAASLAAGRWGSTTARAMLVGAGAGLAMGGLYALIHRNGDPAVALLLPAGGVVGWISGWAAGARRRSRP